MNAGTNTGMVAVGDCNGILLLPGSELADYYRGHACVAVAAAAALCLLVLGGLAF